MEKTPTCGCGEQPLMLQEIGSAQPGLGYRVSGKGLIMLRAWLQSENIAT